MSDQTTETRNVLDVAEDVAATRSHECPFCASGEEPNYCEAESAPDKFLCTREKGHDGPHVACGVSEHEIITWEGGEE